MNELCEVKQDHNTSSTIEKIIKLIDKSVLLGAAYDCMSDVNKEKFKHKLKKIIKGR